MKKAMAVFVVGNLIGAVVIGALLALLPEKQQQYGGFLMMLLMPLPIVMAYIAHRTSGAPGNPFRGLVWGPASLYFLLWIAMVLLAVFAAFLNAGLGFAGFDPAMGDYTEMFAEQAAQGSGGSAPEGIEGMARIIGYSTMFAGPTIGAAFLTAAMCLATFPWLGWLYRRLLVQGTAGATVTLALLWALTSASAGLVDNPATDELSVPVRAGLSFLSTLLAVPAMSWLFLRTRSAVLPALAYSSYSTALGALAVVQSDVNQLLASQLGLVPLSVFGLAGIALWIWKDPGGRDLAVAAVAVDGTPLTPEQVSAGDLLTSRAG
jgi:hypothetical protein